MECCSPFTKEPNKPMLLTPSAQSILVLMEQIENVLFGYGYGSTCLRFERNIYH
jgi:hypothetical protein